MAGVYLHIPFCEHKCIYCDFYSIESKDSVEEFIASLHREIDLYADYGRREPVETIFFGGGTPSLLGPSTVRNIIEHLRSRFTILPDAEVTLEANPGTVDREKLRVFRDAGINRLSFGVQSFHDDELRFLTRIHSSAQAVESIKTAREVGFTNIGLDLIYALPHQTIEQWQENLRRAVDLQPQHISAYSLIVEPGTPLAKMVKAKLISPLPTDDEAAMYEFTMAFLQDAGFQHYEVSNYARPGFRSVHNCNYWNHTNYIGFGPSAHSFWSDQRWWNIASVRPYCRKIERGQLPIVGEEQLTRRQLLDEEVMLSLRSEGINLQRLKMHHGIDLVSSCCSLVDKLLEDGLATLERHLLRLTDRGFLLCDEISQRLVASIPTH